jgi:hypothetical protein
MIGPSNAPRALPTPAAAKTTDNTMLLAEGTSSVIKGTPPTAVISKNRNSINKLIKAVVKEVLVRGSRK